MDRNAILDSIKTLAKSNGFYGRLLRSIEEADEEDRDEFLSELESKNFTDTIDLILYLEA